MLLRDIIAQSARDYPQNVALIFRDQPTSYAELEVAVRRLAAGFHSLGIRQGDKIALLLPNCPPFVFGYYAAAQIGATAVPANPLLKPAELEYIWRDAGVKLVITVGPLLPVAQAARENLPELCHIVGVSPREETDATLIESISGFLTLPELMMQGAKTLATLPADALNPPIDENECAVIMYTSGTTGHPKGAMLSNKNLTRNVQQTRDHIAFTPDDRFLTILPLFHSFAGTVLMNLPLTVGCCVVLLENFIPTRALETMEKHKTTVFAGVPALFNAMLLAASEKEYDLSTMRFVVSGGAPMPEALLRAVEAKFGLPILEGDGPTECSPVTSCNPFDGSRKIGSVGPPLPGVTFAILDEGDKPLPVREIGEICVRGDNVMLGYHNQPEATAEAMKGGWYHTGDLGFLDEDGYCYIVDRKKDMIITAGLNVYPREVEEVLFAHPAVAQAAVIGMPDALRGEEVLAVVVQRPGSTVTERELTAFCRERLANFKTPRRVLFRETLPMGGTGKVVKRLLKKELEMESGV